MSEFSGEIRYSDPPQSRNEELLKAIIEGTQYTDPPQGRNESILKSIIDNTPYDELPQSRIEDLLLQLKEAIVENIPESVKALPTVDTASGSIATFNTDLTENLVDVKCQIIAKQASGTPTPDNPLPIITYTSLNLSHSGSDTSNPTVYNIPFGQTVANGVLDITTGKLRVTHEILKLDGTENITIIGSGANRRFNCGSYPDYSSIISSSHFIESGNNSQPWGYYRFVSGYLLLMDNNEQMADVPTLQTWLADQYSDGTPVQFLCELATPIEIQLDSITLQALLNENNIWCDTGDTEVKFLLSVGKKITSENTRSIASIPVEKSENKIVDELTEKFTDELTKEVIKEEIVEEEKGEE